MKIIMIRSLYLIIKSLLFFVHFLIKLDNRTYFQDFSNALSPIESL